MPFVVQTQPTTQQAADAQAERDEESYARRVNLFLTGFLILITFCTGVVVGWQAWETRKMASTAVTQTTLMRQQLVGTMGAVINCQINPADVGVAVALMNAGQVDARDLVGTVQITPVALPDLKPLAATTEHPFRSAAVARHGHGHWSDMYGFPPEWLPPRDWSRWTDTNTILVDVKFSWDNGFGDRIAGEYGGVYLPHWKYTYNRGSRSEDAHFHNAATVADKWRDISNQLATGRNTQDPD